MHLTAQLSVDVERLALRKALVDAVRQLHEENGLSLRDIAAEMLVVASAVVSNPECDINDAISFAIGTGDDEQTDADEEAEQEPEWLIEMKWREEFESSAIAKEVKDLQEEIFRLNRLGRHNEEVETTQRLLEKLPEHAESWISIVGNSDNYLTSFTTFAEQLMRAYVVMRDRDGFDSVSVEARALSLILEDAQFDYEIFQTDLQRFEEDLDTFETIYDFVQVNPGYPQKNLFKTLSIDGRRSTYMLDWADRLKIISRVRYKDTWLLTAN